MKNPEEKELYRSYMNSIDWTIKKRRAFSFHGKECQRCHSRESLVVHHKTYERLGNEDVKTDLAILCEACHDLYHMSNPEATIKSTDLFIKQGVDHVFIPRQFKKKKKYKDNGRDKQDTGGVYYMKGKKLKSYKNKVVNY